MLFPEKSSYIAITARNMITALPSAMKVTPPGTKVKGTIIRHELNKTTYSSNSNLLYHFQSCFLSPILFRLLFYLERHHSF